MARNIYTNTGKMSTTIGCISLENHGLSFGFPFPEYLMPIGRKTTLLDAAIINCLYFGVSSIWITVNDDYLPLVKKRVGDYGQDPVYYINAFSKYRTDTRKKVPIYFVPTMTRYRDYCDNHTFGFINAALYAQKVYSQLTKYCVPEYYFFSSPFGVFNYRDFSEKRKQLYNKKIIFECGDKSVLTNNQLPICVDKEDIKSIRRHVVLNSNKRHKVIGDFIPNDTSWLESLPKEERFRGKKMSVAEVLSPIDESSFERFELSWFYDIVDWASYEEYTRSNNYIIYSSMVRPNNSLKSFS